MHRRGKREKWRKKEKEADRKKDRETGKERERERKRLRATGGKGERDEHRKSGKITDLRESGKAGGPGETGSGKREKGRNGEREKLGKPGKVKAGQRGKVKEEGAPQGQERERATERKRGRE